jgi:hypothetical protein
VLGQERIHPFRAGNGVLIHRAQQMTRDPVHRPHRDIHMRPTDFPVGERGTQLR